MLPDTTLWTRRVVEVMRLAWPLILSATSTMLMQFADALFLGHWSAHSLAAVTPAGIWVLLLTALAQGPVAYVGTFIAQATGAGKEGLGYRFAWQSIWLALAFGCILGFFTPYATAIFELAGHPMEVVQEEIIYANTLLRFTWVTLLNVAFTAIFVGQGRTRIVGALQFASMFINVILDWLLIFGNLGCPQLGIEGAALGTVAATAFPPLVLSILFWGSRKTGRIAPPDRVLIPRFCRYGFAEGMRLFTDIGIWTVFTFMVGRIGSEFLTANNMVIRITSLVWLPLYGLGRATGQLVGVAVGSKQLNEAKSIVWSGAGLGLLWAVLWAIPMVLTPEIFLSWFPLTASDAYMTLVISHGASLLMIAALLGLFDAINMVVQGGLLGAGDSRWTMRTLVIVHLTMLLALIFGDYRDATASQFWWIACADQIILALFLIKRISQPRWLEHNLTEGLIEFPAIEKNS